jgi:NADPH:quinone reductase-like Zn-dependent oxidoreductase
MLPSYRDLRRSREHVTEAASIWMMFMTPYGALIADAQVTKGDFVIIPAASSSTGLAAIQIANCVGAPPSR